MLLYFFVLAVFGWMLCEGIIVYLQFVNVYTGLGLGGKHLKVFYVIGWGELFRSDINTVPQTTVVIEFQSLDCYLCYPYCTMYLLK